MSSYDHWKTTPPDDEVCPRCGGYHETAAQDDACAAGEYDDDHDPTERADDRPLPTEDDTGARDPYERIRTIQPLTTSTEPE